MGNFDFKACVAQQKREARQEKEKRIIKESKEHLALKRLREGKEAGDILIGFTADDSKIKISEGEFNLICNQLFGDLRESEKRENKALVKEGMKNYYEQIVKEYVSQKKNKKKSKKSLNKS